MIDGKNVLIMRTYDNIRKIGCLLDYNYFNNCYKIIAVDLSKQQVLDANPKVIPRIKSTANRD